MQTRVTEIADHTYRLSTFVPEVGPTGFTFNQFLIDDEQPLLFHTGPRGMFPLVNEAIASIIPTERLRWITFGHVESDECGSMNHLLAAAPQAEVAHGAMGCMVSLNDLCDRPPRALADGEVLELGSHRIRHIDTPHVPHGWEARVLYDETTKTLFAGDLFSNLGDPAPLTTDDIVGRGFTGRRHVRGHLPHAEHGTDDAATGRPRARHDRGDARLVVQRRRCGRAQCPRGRLRGPPHGDIDPRDVTVVLPKHASGT